MRDLKNLIIINNKLIKVLETGKSDLKKTLSIAKDKQIFVQLGVSYTRKTDLFQKSQIILIFMKQNYFAKKE